MAYPYNNFQPGNFGSINQFQNTIPQGFGNQMQMNMTQPTTNKIFVVSADDALSRFASPNSIMVYLLQDETTLFEVYTDGQGKKSIRTRSIIDATPEKPVEYATKDEVAELKKMIESMKGGTDT